MAEETPSVRIIDRIADPAAEPDFSFDGDAPLLEMIFPQVLNADAMLPVSYTHLDVYKRQCRRSCPCP